MRSPTPPRSILSTTPASTPFTALSDAELLAASCDGPHVQRAFRVLVQRHSAFAEKAAMRLARNIDIAREAAQNAWLRVWKHRAEFGGNAAFTTWLYRIVHNCTLDLLRPLAHDPLAHASSVDARDADGTGDVSRYDEPRTEETPESLLSDAVRSRAQETELAARMERLTPTHRATIALRIDAECTTKEIADLMGVPYGTVLSRMHHAMRALGADGAEID